MATGEIKYRVWWTINPPGKPTWTFVPDIQAARELISKEIKIQLSDPNIWGNAFGLEVFEDGEWTEWYDDDGFDILETL